ncbi:Uncharacterised protein [Weissella viridescens]|uniref:Uncharacterized protein n=1 Tax=Weissella viridescens TaxID=1629 RepID=A0A380P210_WEIVI|nr:Uncharacterised protein [Weissella viridescens]
MMSHLKVHITLNQWLFGSNERASRVDVYTLINEFLADHIATKLTSSAKATTPIELLFTAILVIYGDYEAALNKLDVLRRKFQNQFYRKTSGFGGDLDSIWTVTNALLYIDSSIEDNEDVIDNLTSQFKAYKPDSQTEFLKIELILKRNKHIKWLTCLVQWLAILPIRTHHGMIEI